MFIAMLSWGATWVNAKILGSYLSSYELIFLRFLIASIALLPIIYFLKLKLNIGLKNFVLAFASGLLLVLYNYLFFKGCYYGDAGFGGVLVTTLNPIITFLLVSLISFKKISKKEAFALSLGAIGTMTIMQIWSVGLNVWLEGGVKYFLLASFTWPFITILSSYLKNANAIVFSLYMFTIATILDYAIFLNFTISNISSLDYHFWINLLILSIFGTSFGTSIFFIGSAKMGSKWASSYFFLVPFSAAIFAIIFLQEKINLALIVGGFLTIIAIYILNGYNIKWKIFKKV